MKKIVNYISVVAILICLVAGVSVGTISHNTCAKVSAHTKKYYSKKKALKVMKKYLASCEKKLKKYKRDYNKLEKELAKAKEEDKDIVNYDMSTIKQRIRIYTDRRRRIKKDIKKFKKARPGTVFIITTTKKISMPPLKEPKLQ